jgi:Protein of unknown function (DUF2892).
MCDDRIIRRIAGVFIMLSVALGYFVHPGWFGFTAFVGFNLFQSSITGFCPLEKILGRFGILGCSAKQV